MTEIYLKMKNLSYVFFVYAITTLSPISFCGKITIANELIRNFSLGGHEFTLSTSANGFHVGESFSSGLPGISYNWAPPITPSDASITGFSATQSGTHKTVKFFTNHGNVLSIIDHQARAPEGWYTAAAHTASANDFIGLIIVASAAAAGGIATVAGGGPMISFVAKYLFSMRKKVSSAFSNGLKTQNLSPKNDTDKNVENVDFEKNHNQEK